MTIGERIRAARIARGLSQKELAIRCGTIKQTISKYERGIVYNLPLETVKDLAEQLDVTPAYLMGWTEISPNRKALLDFAETATDEQISLLLRLAKAVLEQEK